MIKSRVAPPAISTMPGLSRMSPSYPARPAMGQWPAEGGMKAEAGRHRHGSAILHAGGDVEPRPFDRVGHVELEIERVFGAGALVGLQPHRRALRFPGDDLEPAGAGEAVLGKRVILAVIAVMAALHRADHGEQDRRTALPILWVAVPQQVASLRVGELDHFRTQRRNF